MKKYRYVGRILLAVFMALITILTLNFTNIKAEYKFDDGITNWNGYSSGVSAQFDQLDMGKGLKLGYSFGLANNSSGNVPSGNNAGDSYFLSPSTSSGPNNLAFSKINEFINNGGTYNNVIFQSNTTSTNVSSNSANVSTTSPDFMIVPSDSTSTQIYPRDYGLLGAIPTSGTNNGNEGLTNKKYYVGTDDNGHKVYKITGVFKRTNSSSFNNGTFDLDAEILLRPSPTNVAIVQRELYLHNPNQSTQKFTVLFGEDTMMKNGYVNADNVNVYDIGNKRGIYIDSGSYNSQQYRLYVTNEVPDGFTSYTGQVKSGYYNWADSFSNKTITGTGAESASDSQFGKILTKLGDTAYTLKWNPTTLASGQTAHYSSTMGVAVSPLPIPTASKTYTNETRSTGVNKVGDTLKFTLRMVNSGFNSIWNYKKLVDRIPDGLQIDPDSIRQSNNGGPNQVISSAYDDTTKTLTVTPTINLSDQQYSTITFEAKITNDAADHVDSDNNLTNSATFTGQDVSTGTSNTNDTNHVASVKIPVQQPSYRATFTKVVRNSTNGETNYSTTTDAKKGDTVDFKVVYAVADNSQDYLLKGAVIDDTLPAGLTPDTSSIKIWGPGDTLSYHQDHINTGSINPIQPGKNCTIEFSAKVTGSAVGNLTNYANITNINTSGGQSISSLDSSGATVVVKNTDEIKETPTLIDFGSTNMFGKAQTLTNVSTDGNLVINHPTNSNFNVSVAYDNNSATSQMKNSNDDTLQADSSGLLFIKQRTDSESDLGTWQPILPTGTKIRTTDFNGGQELLNLTNYIGAGDWKIKLAANTEAGLYKGILTWNLVDSTQ